ncbi:MAG: hypothetical protein J6D22_02505 [Pyramidobacter sp.]|nr:hypothetical protein [Pyramidobacter sp.]
MWARALVDDGHLACGGVGAAHAVDLAAVRRTERGQDHLVALRFILGQIFVAEEHGLARAAAHVDAGDLSVGFVLHV